MAYWSLVVTQVPTAPVWARMPKLPLTCSKSTSRATLTVPPRSSWVATATAPTVLDRYRYSPDGMHQTFDATNASTAPLWPLMGQLWSSSRSGTGHTATTLATAAPQALHDPPPAPVRWLDVRSSRCVRGARAVL